MSSDQQKRKAKERAAAELKRYAAIALYLWIILSAFELHRLIILRTLHIGSIGGYRIGFAAINALILGKFIVVGEAFHLGERLNAKLLFYAVLLKSAIFAVLLIFLNALEEVIIGVIHGKSVMASVPQFGGGGLEGIILIGIIMFVVLIPLFLLTEVQKTIGVGRLRSIVFHEESKTDAA